MKKTKLFVGLVLAAGCLSVFAATKKDPVLMTVNGKAVTLSEFEYMYNKNNQQQVAKQPLDKYIDMFTVYKLKVADAEAAGIDTTASFKKEFAGYRNELAAPYLVDTVAQENKAKEIYEHMKYNVKASHIMLPLDRDIVKNKQTEAKLDSIRTCILNGQSFEDLALKYSVDQSVKNNKGSMGYVSVGRFPFEFEQACYSTPVGEISPVFKTDFGYHIVKVYDVRDDEGKVLVEHILKLYPQKATEEQKAEVYAKVDSIYKVIKAGGNFEEIAKKESQDPGSARKGGQLPWFGRGEMVPEFENVSFELAKDSVSAPFATRYGVHIVKKLDSKKLGSYAEERERAMGVLMASPYANIAYQSKLDQLKKQYKLMRNVELEKKLKEEVTSPNALDSAFIARHENSTETLFTIADKNYPLSLLIAELKNVGVARDDLAWNILDARTNRVIDREVAEYERQMLEKNNPEFRNLVNEYRDGMLLFEISNRNVWDKASTDVEGLTKYFNDHRDAYKWNAPKYKGFLIQTTGDSISREVKARLKTLGEDSLVRVLRRDYGKYIKVEKVLVAEGENAMVDSEKFGGPRVKPEKKYSDYFVYGGKVLAQPEEMSDVRGQVVADYQNYLEDEWVAQLRKKYKVTVDNKVLKKLKD